MKVAVCLSGFMRTFRRTISKFHQAFHRYNPDIYISTWDVIGNKQEKKIFNTNRAEESIFAQELINLYGNVACKIEIMDLVSPWGDLNRFTEEYRKSESLWHCNGEEWIKRIFSMFYKVWQADQLRQTYEKLNMRKYDCVVRCRPDNYFLQFPDLRNLLINDNIIYTPSQGSNGGICDQIAIGSSEGMKVYSDFYKDINCYYNPQGKTNNYSPEHQLVHYFHNKGLINHFLNISFNILRSI